MDRSRKGRGRPPVPPKTKKRAIIFARITEDEERELFALAKEMGVTVSQAIRMFIFSALERNRAA
jgi:antitoxin component of RelBE/YafQ-DinJ toxin-antitoxin module